ncbi:hypothetical protein R0K18_26555, partial [Pantoea sp. SIMBA_133]
IGYHRAIGGQTLQLGQGQRLITHLHAGHAINAGEREVARLGQCAAVGIAAASEVRFADCYVTALARQPREADTVVGAGHGDGQRRR